MRSKLVFYAKKLHSMGFFPGTSGNITARLDDGTIIVTPSGRSKDLLSEDDITRVDIEGNIIEGSLKPSSELKMHLCAYRNRPDVKAVVHAHPPFVVAACCAGGADASLLAESVIIFDKVPIAPFALPSTQEVPDSILPFVKDHNGILLAHHGGLTFGRTIEEASNRFESLETLCRVTLILKSAGCFRTITPERIADLNSLLGR